MSKLTTVTQEDFDLYYEGEIPKEKKSIIKERLDMDKKETNRFFTKQTNGHYCFNTGKVVHKLKPGEYCFYETDDGIFLKPESLPELNFIDNLKDNIIQEILDEINNFWKMEPKYKEYKETHKRGYLLWGPPGCGKTFLMREIIKRFIEKENGIVFRITGSLLGWYDEIQQYFGADQKFLLYNENLDEVYNNDNLDSSKSILENFIDNSNPNLSNTILLFTTNFPEKIPKKIIDRPNRIDKIIEIFFPTYDERVGFLLKKSNMLTEKQIKKIADLTEHFSFAHLNEIIMSVELYNRKIENTIDRINTMGDINSEKYQKMLNKRGNIKKGLGF